MTDAELAELLKATTYHPKDNPIPRSVYWCPECGKETVIGVAHDMAVCSNPPCREVHPASPCMRCGELVIGVADAWLCESCEDWFEAQ